MCYVRGLHGYLCVYVYLCVILVDFFLIVSEFLVVLYVCAVYGFRFFSGDFVIIFIINVYVLVIYLSFCFSLLITYGKSGHRSLVSFSACAMHFYSIIHSYHSFWLTVL